MKISKPSSPNVSAKFVRSNKETTVPQAGFLTAGKILKERRLQLGYSLQKISEDTKIQKKYLEQIEREEHDSKSSVVFINGFTKIYADYLGLDVDKVSALYRRSIKQDADKSVKKSQRKNRAIDAKSLMQKLVTPQNVVFGLIAIFILGLGVYLSIQFYNFQRPPLLEINSPQNNSEVKEEKLVVKGTTEENTTIKVNGETVNVDSRLAFKKEISLKEGTNSITIKATKQNNTSNENVKIITIKYVPEVTEIPAEVVTTPTAFFLKVNVVNAEAWIQIIVDDSQKEAEILPLGYSQTFEFKTSFKVISGRPGNTQIFVNDKPESLTVDSQTGTAQLTCEVNKNTYECR